MTAPAMARFFASGAGTTADRIVALYRTAREAAFQRGKTVTVRVAGTGEWVLTAGAGAEADTLRVGSVGVTTGTRLNAERGFAETSFHPLGTARGDRLTVSDQNRRYEIVVEPWTAEIRARPF